MGPKEREIKRRLRVLEHANKIGNVRMTYPTHWNRTTDTRIFSPHGQSFGLY